ncbi:MAG: hypothetical protein WCJ24_02705 [Candidatus Saccharibacteria bacterium]
MSKKKHNLWFIKVRGSYLPNSWQGALTYIPFLTFLVASLIVTINNIDSLALAALLIFPQWVAAAVVMTWIASRES